MNIEKQSFRQQKPKLSIELEAVLSFLDGTKWLIAALLYSACLRLMECLRVRITPNLKSRRVKLQESQCLLFSLGSLHHVRLK